MLLGKVYLVPRILDIGAGSEPIKSSVAYVVSYVGLHKIELAMLRYAIHRTSDGTFYYQTTITAPSDKTYHDLPKGVKAFDSVAEFNDYLRHRGMQNLDITD